ncbi:hypothetical protein FNV43_RR23939 [Rhamnella rubrinervis]|uniref:Uncharacterized protein n=1 Tax=Rhamnella rubrinervis TaxID=2594499 RepID=A0A8K0GKQ8_9ROSA|nr:hypothetical protein FNV43_RR23939 [Rhamnella rubrinervis]
MGGEGQILKRIPRIKFPKRHSVSPSGSGSTSDTQQHAKTNRTRSDVPAAPTDTAVGGKASLQPKRTPVSDREIEAILLGGCL